VQSRRELLAQRRKGWARVAVLGRAITSTGGLLAAAALLLGISWLLLGQGQGGLGGGRRAAGADKAASGPPSMRIPAASLRSAQAFVFRDSLLRQESPTQRLDLMIEARLLELRGTGTGEGEHGVAGRGPAMGAVP